MLLGGVAVEDRLVRTVAASLDKSLRHKLDSALLFRSQVVGLTVEERRAILAALERKPELDHIRMLLLADQGWRTARGT